MHIKDLSGQRFGRLTAIRRTEQKRKSCYLWLCHCDCGRECLVSTHFLTHGLRKSCGCIADNPRHDLTGQIFGRLTVIKPTIAKKRGGFIWHCQCDCGKIVNVPTNHLTGGQTQSCGCLHIDTAKTHAKTIRINNHVDGTNVGAIKSTRIHVNNTSGVRGVSWHKHRQKWVARICFQGRSIGLGYYDNLADAAKARKTAEEKYFGEYLKSKTT